MFGCWIARLGETLRVRFTKLLGEIHTFLLKWIKTRISALTGVLTELKSPHDHVFSRHLLRLGAGPDELRLLAFAADLLFMIHTGLYLIHELIHEKISALDISTAGNNRIEFPFIQDRNY